ncbi:hypothetical protein F66182_15192 [Fusarium sp. NRRL 66182]|nr:hypothetical protein F66182_15192 [Fusarium sp. NRRL 66182]
MAAPPRSPTFTEFIVFRLKPSVKPEEGESNREGEQLLDLFRETMLQSGHLGSAWGRALEDENVVIWVIDTLTTNPITEFVTFAAPSDISPDQHKQFNNDQAAFRDALLTKITPESARPVTWARGQVERPTAFEHQDSPSGKALVYVNVVGWKSREHHMQARDTKVFAETIEPVRKHLLTPVKGLEMKHVKFQKIGF